MVWSPASFTGEKSPLTNPKTYSVSETICRIEEAVTARLDPVGELLQQAVKQRNNSVLDPFVLAVHDSFCQVVNCRVLHVSADSPRRG